MEDNGRCCGWRHRCVDGPSVHSFNGVGGTWFLDLLHVLSDHVVQRGIVVPDL